jgi:hypothetical protein
MLLHGPTSKTNTSWLELILHPFSVGTSHGQPWTHLIHHGLDSGEATTFPHILFSVLLRGSHIRMALFPGTPKEESRNCPGLDSRDFGHSYLLAPTSDWSEVWTKVVALLDNFPMPCRTSSEDIRKRSIPDFSWSGVKLQVWLPTLLLPINWAEDVQMDHARPFWTSTLQDLSIFIKNTPMQCVLTLAIKL